MFTPSFLTATTIELPRTRSHDKKKNTRTQFLFRKSAYMRKRKSEMVVSGKMYAMYRIQAQLPIGAAKQRDWRLFGVQLYIDLTIEYTKG
jgi:hypothetical protein